MTAIPDIFNELRKRFNKNAAASLELIFQFDVTDGNTYHLLINNGILDIQEGAHNDPNVTLIMNKETMEGIINGSVDGMQAFMQGKLRAEGDIMLATKFAELFS